MIFINLATFNFHTIQNCLFSFYHREQVDLDLKECPYQYYGHDNKPRLVFFQKKKRFFFLSYLELNRKKKWRD